MLARAMLLARTSMRLELANSSPIGYDVYLAYRPLVVQLLKEAGLWEQPQLRYELPPVYLEDPDAQNYVGHAKQMHGPQGFLCEGSVRCTHGPGSTSQIKLDHSL